VISTLKIKNAQVGLPPDEDQRFWKDEIFKLPERWRKVIEQNGTYII